MIWMKDDDRWDQNASGEDGARWSDLGQIWNWKLIRPLKVLFIIEVEDEYVAPIVTMRKIWIICKIITFLKPIRELRPQNKPKTWNSKKWHDSHTIHRLFHFWGDARRRGGCQGSKKKQDKFLANSQSPAVGWWTSAVSLGAVDSRGACHPQPLLHGPLTGVPKGRGQGRRQSEHPSVARVCRKGVDATGKCVKPLHASSNLFIIQSQSPMPQKHLPSCHQSGALHHVTNKH